MPTTILNLADLDNLIAKFEQKYNVSSLQMLKDANVRKQIAEDVLLRWETYVGQRIQLRELYQHTHNEYLGKLKIEPDSGRSQAPSDEVALAA
jgi:hypothetical protein